MQWQVGVQNHYPSEGAYSKWIERLAVIGPAYSLTKQCSGIGMVIAR